MLIADAQLEVRTVYLGGSVGQLVSALIWFASAAIATFVDAKTGFWTLAIGGAAIFPLTQALLRLAGSRAALNHQNPLGNLAIQIAFTVPFVLPVAGAAACHKQGWFYPACMVIVGAHYLPFVFLYGMKTFAVLAAALLGAGFAIGFIAPDEVVMGGWVGGAILFASAFGLLAAFKRGQKAQGGIDGHVEATGHHQNF
jgi:hypothetical protein